MKNYRTLRLIAIVVLEIIFLAVFLAVARSCSLAKKKQAAPTGECSKENDVRQLDCPQGGSGRIFQVCKENKWQETFNDCKAGSCGDTVFDRDLAPLISGKCVSCHTGFNTFDTAKTKIDEFIRRTANNDMPKGGPPLSDDEKAKFVDWKNDGLQPSCPDDATAKPFIGLDDLELSALNDINAQNDQANVRWLYTAHKSDEGLKGKDLAPFEQAIQKGINGLSFGRILVLAEPVDEFESLFRINLNDLKLSAAQWKLIEDNDPVDLESNTNVGALLKQLTKTRKPMMNVDAFLTSAMKAQVYYAIRKIPTDLNTFLGQQGVNQNTQIDNFEALQLGMIGEISLNKNRLLVRYDSNDGFFWQTYDVNDQPLANKNLEQFPLLKASDPKNNYKFDASEVLFSLPNGLMGGALFDSAGKRQDAAPLNVVAHNIKPPADPTIKIQSCSRCHAIGLIPKTDTIRAKVDANAINFDLRDVDLVDQLYRDPAPDFADDNGAYSASLAKLGISANEPDPISASLDSIQERRLDAKAVGALYLLSEADFKDCLSRSVDGRAQVGSLLNGGSISFEQFKEANAVVKRDCRIGLEPIVLP